MHASINAMCAAACCHVHTLKRGAPGYPGRAKSNHPAAFRPRFSHTCSATFPWMGPHTREEEWDRGEGVDVPLQQSFHRCRGAKSFVPSSSRPCACMRQTPQHRSNNGIDGNNMSSTPFFPTSPSTSHDRFDASNVCMSVSYLEAELQGLRATLMAARALAGSSSG